MFTTLREQNDRYTIELSEIPPNANDLTVRSYWSRELSPSEQAFLLRLNEPWPIDNPPEYSFSSMPSLLDGLVVWSALERACPSLLTNLTGYIPFDEPNAPFRELGPDGSVIGHLH